MPSYVRSLYASVQIITYKNVLSTDDFIEEWDISKDHRKRQKNRDRITYPGCKGYPKEDKNEKIEGLDS